MKLTVSIQTYNEIASLLEKEGLKITENRALTIEKGTALVPPVDYRLVTIRRDCIVESAKICVAQDEDIVECADRIYRYVLEGKTH